MHLRASHHLSSTSLACCTFTRKVHGEFFWLNFLGSLYLFLPSKHPQVPLLHARNVTPPPLGGFGVSLTASGSPQGSRSFNAIHEDAIGMLRPIRVVGSFHFRMVWGEGIASLGVFGALSSFILESFSCRASQSLFNSSNHLW